ncbi:MAG: arginine--tRNA ligase [Limnochordia bacterium]
MFRQRIAGLVQEALPEEAVRQLDIGTMIEVPADQALGDYAFPTFSLARVLRQAPPRIAQEVAGRITPPPWVERMEVVGGYLNFFIDKSFMVREVLKRIQDEGDTYGSSQKGEGRTVVIDFSSPNIAKPVAVGLIRTTVLGHSLYRIFSHQGFRVERVNHLGDWGTQCGKWIVAYELWGDEERLKAEPIKELFQLYVRFHQEAETQPELDDRAREAFRRLEQGDPQLQALWRRFRDLSVEEFERVYARMGIEFDSYAGEAFYEDKMSGVLDMLAGKGLLKESEGATIVELEDLPPCLIKKSDGSTLYATRDLAAALYRWEHYHPALVLYVVGAPQQLHFRQVFAVLRLMGMDWVANYEHVPFGTIRLGDEAMSTRRGNVVFLEDLLDEATERARAIIDERNPGLADKAEVAEMVGIGAVIFYFLMFNRMKDISFDWAAALNYEGDSGPYVQYTFARAGSVLRRANAEVLPAAELNTSALTEPEELALVKELARFEAVVASAEAGRDPSAVARYLLELCRAFNGFYHAHRIVGSELMAERLALLDATRTVIRNGLHLLGIQAPEEM